MNYSDLTTHYYLTQIPTKKSFGGFGSAVIKDKDYALGLKLAGMQSMGFALTNPEFATEAVNSAVEASQIDKKGLIAELRTVEGGGFKKRPSRKIEPLYFTIATIRSGLPFLTNFEHKFLDGHIAFSLASGNHFSGSHSQKLDNQDVLNTMAYAITWGLVVGLEFREEATDILQIWIRETAEELEYPGHHADSFFVDAPKSLAELNSVCSKPYYLWKPS